ncbi:hypothetical protein ACYSNR_01210 [Enterococcus sp. LJL128]
MSTITTIEDFWDRVNELRIERELNWRELVGGNASLAAEKRFNPTLTRIFQMQEKLEVNLFNLPSENQPEIEEQFKKNPETPKKMTAIYDLTRTEDWMNDEQIVRRVQELAKTII